MLGSIGYKFDSFNMKVLPIEQQNRTEQQMRTEQQKKRSQQNNRTTNQTRTVNIGHTQTFYRTKLLKTVVYRF